LIGSDQLVCDVLAAGGIDGVVALDLDSRAAEGSFSVPAEHLSAVAVLCDGIRAEVREGAVIGCRDLHRSSPAVFGSSSRE
jgi:ribose-phosphate pyrophosphokinase